MKKILRGYRLTWWGQFRNSMDIGGVVQVWRSEGESRSCRSLGWVVSIRGSLSDDRVMIRRLGRRGNVWWGHQFYTRGGRNIWG